jgi:hypothetical protein
MLSNNISSHKAVYQLVLPDQRQDDTALIPTYEICSTRRARARNYSIVSVGSSAFSATLTTTENASFATSCGQISLLAVAPANHVFGSQVTAVSGMSWHKSMSLLGCV